MFKVRYLELVVALTLFLLARSRRGVDPAADRMSTFIEFNRLVVIDRRWSMPAAKPAS